MTSEIEFNTDFIKNIDESLSFNQTVELLSKNLLEKDLVKKDYPQQVQKRELNFPTGLPTEPIGVAIPHTDPQYVNKNAISVGILKHPISMTVMGTDDQTVDVSIIFLLSLTQANKQLNILKRIMGIVQNQKMLKEFMTDSNTEIFQKVNRAVLEEEK
ncbi:PTS sugar transporter subunit IIA [Companilactobacillus zhachilii]|uniref:PTS sugar transporter subunit IIA n=1 Tax=Companilactobacillus zhachilii TaxID=2304606 RepID=UPI00403461BB